MTHRILLVDDNPDEIDVAVRALNKRGLGDAVDVAHDGQEALEKLGLESSDSRAGLRPSVIFLDLKMPRVDGWEVLRRIRESESAADVPVVVLSSSDRTDDIRRCYALGANSFVVKHFDPASPGAYIADAARYWLDLNRPPPRRKS